MNNRQAFTLIELSVSMTAGIALLVLAIGFLHQSMSLASIARDRSDHQRTLNRLAQDFRDDAHRAAQCTAASTSQMHFRMSDESDVTYEIIDTRVSRIQQHDGFLRRESFEFLPGTTATLETVAEPTRAVLTVLHRPHGSLDQTRVDRMISAAVGRMAAHESAEVSP